CRGRRGPPARVVARGGGGAGGGGAGRRQEKGEPRPGGPRLRRRRYFVPPAAPPPPFVSPPCPSAGFAAAASSWHFLMSASLICICSETSFTVRPGRLRFFMTNLQFTSPAELRPAVPKRRPAPITRVDSLMREPPSPGAPS